MATPVDLTATLQSGRQYTFTFNITQASGLDLSTILAQLQTIGGLSQVTLKASGFIGSRNLDVTFIPIGSFVAGDLVRQMLDAMAQSDYLDHLIFGGFNFVAATTGAVGLPSTFPGNNPSWFPDLGAIIWPLIILGSIAIFVFSGGIGWTKRAFV